MIGKSEADSIIERKTGQGNPPASNALPYHAMRSIGSHKVSCENRVKRGNNKYYPQPLVASTTPCKRKQISLNEFEKQIKELTK